MTRPLLTAADEQTLAVRVQTGDAAAVGQLVAANIRLALRFAKRCVWPRARLSHDEILQSAYIGLWQAARRYQPGRARFSTVATWWMMGAVAAEFRRSRRAWPVSDRDAVDETAAVDVRHEVRDILDRISVRSRRVLLERFVAGKTHTEAGAAMGVGKSRVQQLENEAIRQFKRVAAKR